MSLTIIDALKDERLFKPFIADADGSLASWAGWLACLKAIYGIRLPRRRHEFFREVTGRDATKLPANGFDTVLALCGRRSGKTRMAAVIAAYEAALAGNEEKLSAGEEGLVLTIAPTRWQAARAIKYLKGVFASTPLLAREVAGETKESLTLRNGITALVLAGDWRTVRGGTALCVLLDEAAFLGLDADSRVKNDAELVQAVKPSLATTRGKLIAISSPYAKKGWCWTQFQRCFGNDAARTLVINAPSRLLNPTLPQSVVDDALAEDPAAARSEWLAEFRDDVGQFLPREAIERLAVTGRRELMPDDALRYVAFADLSGGRGDDAALAIAHKAGRTVVLDKLVRYRPPFNPTTVVALMADEVRKYGVKRVVGDNYAAEFVAGAFAANGLKYLKAEKNKSALYLELLPRLCSGEVELLDDPALIDQLAGLERRTRSGGKDVIDHPHGGKDDLANAVAGVVEVAAARRVVAGALPASTEPDSERRQRWLTGRTD